MNLFCLPEYSILIGQYETTGLHYFNLAKSHVNNRFYFGVDPIHLDSISTGLYTYQSEKGEH